MSRARVDIRLATAGALAAELALVASSLARNQEESTWPYVLVGGVVGVACARATWAPATARRLSVVAPVSSALVVLLASPLRSGVAFLVGSGDPGALRLAFGRGVIGLVAAVAAGLVTLRGARAARAAGVGRSLAVEALGAALGIGLVGYELVPRLGMRVAVLIAAGLDVALLLLSRASRDDVVEVSAPASEPASARRVAAGLATGAVVGALVTEWLRLLPLVSGDTGTGAPLPTCALLLCFAAGSALAATSEDPIALARRGGRGRGRSGAAPRLARLARRLVAVLSPERSTRRGRRCSSFFGSPPSWASSACRRSLSAPGSRCVAPVIRGGRGAPCSARPAPFSWLRWWAPRAR